MADRPIIFSAPMVRALLDGRKTQTRRVLGNSGPGRGRSNIFSAQIGWSDSYVLDPGNANWRERDTPYAPGDRLWVREAWQTGTSDDGPQISYRATPDYFEIDAWDGEDFGVGPSFNEGRCPGATFSHWLPDVLADDGPWRSPIHMPRWASRLTLTITDVRVQRLQEISAEDVTAEGIEPLKSGRGYYDPTVSHDQSRSIVRFGQYYSLATHAFSALWDSIHGPDAWDANPWVAAISFTVHRCNIDTMEEGTW